MLASDDPRPRIAYGAFDYNGRPITPGTTGMQLGYGIVNQPHGMYFDIVPTPDHYLLPEYLKIATDKYEEAAILARWDAIPNKLDLLVGCKINDFYFYSDEAYFRFYTPYAPTERSQVTLNFGSNQCSYGIHTREEIANHLYGHMPVKIEAVDGDIITLEGGFQFAMTGRFRDEQPTFSTPNADRVKLIRSLDMRRNAEDSTTQH